MMQSNHLELNISKLQHLEQGCQTQLHRGPKLKAHFRSRAKQDKYLLNTLKQCFLNINMNKNRQEYYSRLNKLKKINFKYFALHKNISCQNYAS